MAFTSKLLGEGQLAIATGTLYTVPASTTTIVKTIILTNSDASSRTVNIYLNSGTHRRITPKELTLGAGETYIIDEVLTLEATDTIRGDASAGTVVDYIIAGVEEA